MQQLWKTVWGFFKTLKIELPYQFHSWVFIQKKTKILIQKYTCTPMLLAVLFTIAKAWKQPKCPLTNDWLKKMCYRHTHTQTHTHTHSGILLTHKKEENFAICSNVDGPREYYTFFFFSLFLGPLPQHMEVPRLGV